MKMNLVEIKIALDWAKGNVYNEKRRYESRGRGNVGLVYAEKLLVKAQTHFDKSCERYIETEGR